MDRKKLEALIGSIRGNPQSDFYRTLWGSVDVFENLPTVSREDFIRVPLSKRRFKNEKALVKIVRDEKGPFLSEWGFADIGQEAYGVQSKRPLVYLSDPHEAIEKSMWCYGNNMVPLIGEKDSELAAYAAEKYQVDSLISDTLAVHKLLPYLRSRSQKLSALSVLGSIFNVEELLPLAEFSESVRLVRTLPETGAFAEATLSTEPHFTPLPDCILHTEEVFIVTKVRSLVTPIIRYRTDIPVPK